MLATLAAADSASTVIKKYSVFIYSEAEPHAKYAIYKHTRKFCVLQYYIHDHQICFFFGTDLIRDKYAAFTLLFF